MKFRGLSSKIKSGYGALAIIVLNSIIIFLVLNLIASAVINFQSELRKKADSAKGRYSFKKYEDPIKVLFPDLDKNDINRLLIEIRHVSQIFDTYTQFKEKPFVGKFVNVDAHGFRPIKDQGPWPPNPKKINVFVFGGSTTFGYGVTDQQTIPSYMQEILATKYNGGIEVYNFGRGGYISVQERILFEKLIGSGIVPNVAVFIDGLNDLGYGDDDPAHTKELTKFMAEGEKPPFTNCLKQMPIFRLIFGRTNRVKTQPHNANEKIDNAIKRYEINRKLIEAVSNAFTIHPLFVWQPTPVYNCDPKYNLFATFDYNGYMPYLKKGYERMASHVANRQLGDDFIWLADIQEGLHKSLYADAIHYSPYLCKVIAGKIVNALEAQKVFKND
ncbi:MAG: SGNH/GDSL hydrolase family protein [Desulfomonilaceae bacterium]